MDILYWFCRLTLSARGPSLYGRISFWRIKTLIQSVISECHSHRVSEVHTLVTRVKDAPRTERIKFFIMAVNLEHRYSNEPERANWDDYDDFKLKKTSVSTVYTKLIRRFQSQCWPTVYQAAGPAYSTPGTMSARSRLSNPPDKKKKAFISSCITQYYSLSFSIWHSVKYVIVLPAYSIPSKHDTLTQYWAKVGPPSFEDLCYVSTAIINVFTLKVRGSTLYVRKTDVYRRQKLTSIDVRFWRIQQSIPAL